MRRQAHRPLGPSADVVFMSDPADVRAVFHGRPDQMNMGDINGLFRRVLGRSSLLVIDGEEHLRQRRLLLPPFKGERIAALLRPGEAPPAPPVAVVASSGASAWRPGA